MGQPSPYERNQSRVLGRLLRGEQPKLSKPYRDCTQEAGFGSAIDGDDLEARTTTVITAYIPAMLGVIDQSCANNAATNITLGAVASYKTFEVIYNVTYSTTHHESGRCTVFHDGTNAKVTGWQKASLGTGLCLASLTADVNTGNLRLIVTTLDLGGAFDFRATYIRVSA